MTNRDVADRLAIFHQVYRYCRAVDRLDIPLGHSVFHEDSYVDIGAYQGSGRGWIESISEELRHFLHHSHQATNIVICLDGDRAGSETYLTATLRAREGNRVVQRQFWARYVDRWSRRDGNWAIDRREAIIDFDSMTEVTPMGEHERGRRDRLDASYRVLEALE